MCGVFGVYGHPEAANLTYLGLHALQHRGQESAGIVSTDGQRLYAHRSMGLVQAGFTPRDLENLPGTAAVGHVRYSTAGESHLKNAQPLAVSYARGSIAVAHNGNLTNAEDLRERLEARGSIFQTDSDTEVIVHLIAVSTQRSVEDRVAEALGEVHGAYSIVMLTEHELIAVRDPMGIRPRCLGKLDRGGDAPTTWILASEPTSFDLIGGVFVRDIEPGEMLVIAKDGLRSTRPFKPQPRRACIFEYVYFARPDALIEGRHVYEVRKNLGSRLAIEHPVDCDVVVPVPDSGVPAAIGYARQAGVPFEIGLIRSHYVGRTFIEPQQSIRHFGVRLKLNPVRAALEGKRVVVVDDSIVRGTTSRKIVKMIRAAGAKEVHMRISSPPTSWPCYYGIDTPTRAELIASTHTTEEIARYITADSLGYLSMGGLVTAVRSTPASHASEAARVSDAAEAREPFCHACFSGDYPIRFVPSPRQKQLRLVSG